MKYIDISVALHKKMPVYRNEGPFALEWVRRIGPSVRSNNSRIIMGSHSGTHIDAPSHFLPGGRTIERLDLNAFIGPCRVISVPGAAAVEPRHLGGVRPGDRVLFRTPNTARKLFRRPDFVADFTALSPQAAVILARRKVRLVGIDYLSVEIFGRPKPEAHWALLRAGVGIIEGLDLSKAAAGRYELICLPLKVIGAEGAPARAILRRIG